MPGSRLAWEEVVHARVESPVTLYHLQLINKLLAYHSKTPFPAASDVLGQPLAPCLLNSPYTEAKCISSSSSPRLGCRCQLASSGLT